MVAVIDYGMGNTGSVLNMLRHVGVEATLAASADEIVRADRLILPGVGAFGAGMAALRERDLVTILEQRVLHDGVPILGICLGLQLFGTSSEEGSEPGLGWLEARSQRFRFDTGERTLKVPHMGWNTVAPLQPHDPLLTGLESEGRFYFVHSYHLATDASSLVVGTCHYGYDFPAILRHGNICGVQFHPEKSHRYGMRLMSNFCTASPVRHTPVSVRA